jgi:hypothetical protein
MLKLEQRNMYTNAAVLAEILTASQKSSHAENEKIRHDEDQARPPASFLTVPGSPIFTVTGSQSTLPESIA